MSNQSKLELDLIRRELELERESLETERGLPHLYSFKHYKWSRKFFESRNKINLLLAGNQLSKSTTQIRKAIEWATNKNLWPILWSYQTPNQFWYLYPAKDVASIEFETKWRALLPQGKFKDDDTYGWEEEWQDSHIFAVHFNNGLSIYFKTYAQNPAHLQSGTCFAIFADEEVPVKIYDELMFRLAATDGYYHMAFTATLGQEFWREAMEEIGNDKEKLPGALKLQVSMYDCLEYEDKSPTPWTKERIARIISRCKSDTEVQRRVWGKFVVEQGRKYEVFSRSHNVCAYKPIHSDWSVYSGVDIGSGGENGHPAAIAFVAVRPDYKKGAVFLGWRGDGIVTTAGDILDQYRALRGSMRPVLQLYDHQSKDFHTVASRQNETFTKAEKGAVLGEDILSTLFKNQMLDIYDTPELQKLMIELSTLKKSTPKSKAKDDLIDAVRFAVTKIPWDFSGIIGVEGYVKPEAKAKTLNELRREGFIEEQEQAWKDIEEELEAWNELYEF